MTKWTLPTAFGLMAAGVLVAQPPATQPGTAPGTTAQPGTTTTQPGTTTTQPGTTTAQPGAVTQPGTVAPGGAPGAAQPQAQLRPLTDADFILVAGSGGLFEITSSQLAVQKSQNQQVKQFAQQMITDHTKLNQQMVATLGRRNMSVATTLNPVHSAMVQRLQAAGQGQGFEKEYVIGQIAAHGEAAAVFEQYAQTGRDQELVALARAGAPVIRQHLEMAVAMGPTFVKGGGHGHGHDAAPGATGSGGGTTGGTGDTTGGTGGTEGDRNKNNENKNNDNKNNDNKNDNFNRSNDNSNRSGATGGTSGTGAPTKEKNNTNPDR